MIFETKKKIKTKKLEIALFEIFSLGNPRLLIFCRLELASKQEWISKCPNGF